MRKLFFIPILIVSIISIQSCKKRVFDPIVIPDTPEEPLNEDIVAFNTYLSEQMNALNIPGISVTIFRKDEILYDKQMGKANIQEDENLTKDHLFLMASASKIITATALLQLYEYGHFSLDDAINDFLPFTVANPNSATPITFRMLLTHTSGIADGSVLDDLYYDGYDSPLPIDYFAEEYLVPGGSFYNATENFRNFEPGTQYEYSNAGSTLMAVLVQEISSQDFDNYCKNKIFTPMGMTQTFWKLNKAKQSNFPLVTPYNYVNNQFDPIDQYAFTHFPSGGLRSTGRDMMKFFSALANDGEFNLTHLLNDNTIDMMFSQQIPSINNKMGFHVFLLDPINFLWGDDGSIPGASTIVGVGPFSDMGVIILTNQGDVDLKDLLYEGYQLGLKL
jgi:CubicO group peptidase (beta-lactamase class C family)